MRYKFICLLCLFLLVSCTSGKDSRQEIQTAISTPLVSPTIINTLTSIPTKNIELELIKGDIWVNDVALGLDNSVWLLSGEKVFEFHKNTWSEYEIPSQLSFCSPSDFVIIDNLVIGFDNSIWVGVRCRLLHFGGKTWTAYSTENGLAEGDISDITLDKSGNLWLGTRDGNASKFDGQQWTTYTESETTKLVSIDSILALPDGTLWLGGFKGISRFDGKNWTLYEHKAEHWSIGADVIASADKNSVWTFDGSGGSYYFDTKSWTEIKNLDRAIFTSALAISDKDVWVGTLKGLFHFDGQEWIKISDLAIESIVQGQDGRIWVGTRKGLYSFAP